MATPVGTGKIAFFAKTLMMPAQSQPQGVARLNPPRFWMAGFFFFFFFLFFFFFFIFLMRLRPRKAPFPPALFGHIYPGSSPDLSPINPLAGYRDYGLRVAACY